MQVARFAIPEHEAFSLFKTIAGAPETLKHSLLVMQGVSKQQNVCAHPKQHQPPRLAPAASTVLQLGFRLSGVSLLTLPGM